LYHVSYDSNTEKCIPFDDTVEIVKKHIFEISIENENENENENEKANNNEVNANSEGNKQKDLDNNETDR